MPLGFSEQETYRQVTFPRAAGDVLVFYSDGVTEARNAAGEFFGVDRLMEIIGAKHHTEQEGLLAVIQKAVRAFSSAKMSTDDFTCVAVTLDHSGQALALAHAQSEMSGDELRIEKPCLCPARDDQ